jgi:hypothetical protein
MTAIVMGSPAEASLIGRSMTATYQYPDLGTVYSGSAWTPPSFVVGTGEETVGTIEGVTDLHTDFGASNLTITLDTVLDAPVWNAAAFNGPVFTAGAPLGITGASVDAATTMPGFDASRVSFAGDQIALDWAGLGYVNGTVVKIDFAFSPVPEPAGFAILGTGLAGLAALRRRVRG